MARTIVCRSRSVITPAPHRNPYACHMLFAYLSSVARPMCDTDLTCSSLTLIVVLMIGDAVLRSIIDARQGNRGPLAIEAEQAEKSGTDIRRHTVGVDLRYK